MRLALSLKVTLMTALKLADVAIESPKPPMEWSNKEQRRIPLDPRREFIKQFSDLKSDWQARTFSQSLFFRKSNVPNDAAMYHRNYLEYLSKCWTDHLGAVISPEIVWFTLLTELAGMVNRSPEKFRKLFSESEEKQSVIIVTGELVEMPLDALVGSLKKLVPEDTDQFMPDFSTATDRSRHAFHAAFCDLVSPYYNYGMMLCAIPAIDVRGSVDDWQLMKQSWDKLTKVFGCAGDWFKRVGKILDSCIENRENAEWWRNIFHLTKCGSGSQVEVSGWYADLFLTQPNGLRYVENFPSCIATVNYKQLNFDFEYTMKDGLFYSCAEGDFMRPDFGFTIHQKIEIEPERWEKTENFLGDSQSRERALQNFMSRCAALETGYGG